MGRDLVIPGFGTRRGAWPSGGWAEADEEGRMICSGSRTMMEWREWDEPIEDVLDERREDDEAAPLREDGRPDGKGSEARKE